jgi:hypothetical protein
LTEAGIFIQIEVVLHLVNNLPVSLLQKSAKSLALGSKTHIFLQWEKGVMLLI